MAKKIDWAVNIDKLKVCLNMPENLYDYLSEHYTRYDEHNKIRILDEDDFLLVFIDEEEMKMTAVLNIKDTDGYFRLGTFLFNNGKKYEKKAFFTFENETLYRVFSKDYHGKPNGYIHCLLYVAGFYGM